MRKTLTYKKSILTELDKLFLNSNNEVANEKLSCVKQNIKKTDSFVVMDFEIKEFIKWISLEVFLGNVKLDEQDDKAIEKIKAISSSNKDKNFALSFM